VLPALAGVPDEADGAECLLLGRPTTGDNMVTFLSDSQLRELHPVGSPVEVHVLHRATDFFIGRWSFRLRLRQRMRMISDAALDHLTSSSVGQQEEQGGVASLEEILRGTGSRVDLDGIVEEWPTLMEGQQTEIHTSGYSGHLGGGGRTREDAPLTRDHLMTHLSRKVAAARKPPRAKPAGVGEPGWYHAYRSAQ